MDALEVLKQMHEEAKENFVHIEQTSAEQRAGLWARLRPELLTHEQMEERYVYGPVCAEGAARDSSLAGWDERHHREVEEAEMLIDDLGRLDPENSAWLDRLQTLRSILERHIEEEEGVIWPQIRRIWDQERLDSVGRRLDAAKTAARAGASIAGDR